MTNEPTGRELAYAHFQSDAGEPVLQPASVLFWDVMGISAMSKAPTTEALAHLRALRAAVTRARERAGTEEPGFMSCSSWFTDNVVLASPTIGVQDEEQTVALHFIDSAYMQLYMLGAGYLSRGAITFGLHYMDDTFVFGPALIDAVELEKDEHGPAWPCVTVSTATANMARTMGREYYGSLEQSPFASELKVDEQDRVFVDQLGIWLDEEDDPAVVEHWLPRYRALIFSKLEDFAEGTRVWARWRWLADYHDYALRDRRYDEPEFLIGLDAVNAFGPLIDTA